MTGTTRWAMSRLDFCVHLLVPAAGHSTDVLTARCGRLLPMSVTQHDQPPPGPPCERCRLIFLADAAARDSSHPQDVPK